MSRVRKAIVALGTFAVALGTGFVMQYSDALAGRGNDSAAPVVMALGSTVPAGIQPSLADQPALPEVPSLVILPGQSRPEAVQPPAAQPERLVGISMDRPAVLVEKGPVAAACRPVVTARALPGAMVAVALDSGCGPDATVTVHHAGMIFSAKTDRSGHADLILPALATPAVVMVEVQGRDAMATVAVPDLALYHRAVLQWQGALPLALHAREDDALYGSAGHVWSGAPGTVEGLVAGKGGLMTVLGDSAAADGFHAQVFSFPASARPRAEVALEVEAQVTEAACGQVLAAQTLQVTPGRPALARDIAPRLPGCAATGEFLVLSNMLRDLTLAAR